MYRYLRYVPKNHLSRAVGRLVHARMPAPIARRLVRWFADTYKIDVDAAGKPLHEYPSIGHFFIRDLAEGLRPIEGEFVSPVDGVLRNFGLIENGRIEQVKGKTYTLARFLGDENAARYEGGAFFNLYLSPQDYHHVHSPVGGAIARSVHIPGMLWPVNDWSLENIDELFSVNERVVTYIDTEHHGRVAAVMIGATNVGKISVTYDSFISNSANTDRTVARDYDPPIPIEAGARLGTFHMGSSVVVLLEPGRVNLKKVRLDAGKKVRYGEAVLHGELFSSNKA